MAALAERQYGVVGRWQLLGEGWSDGAIRARIAHGRLHPLHAGVYRVGHGLVQQEGRWMAAVLAFGPTAVLSHWSAAGLWLIRANSREIIDVTAPWKSRSWKGVKRHHKALPPDEVTVREGIPVTTVPRTILDLAATVPVDAVENLLRETEFREHRDKLSLLDLIKRYPGRRGVRRVRLALEALEDDPPGRRRRGLEERFAAFLRIHALPQPRFNDWIVLGEKRYQVDCHWPDTHLIVELDSWQAHSTRSAFRSDRARDRALLLAGYRVSRITWAQLDDEPERIAADLRALLRTQ
ncbi:MAG TPA: type IV toxin-antitoxin system AbiEi family antitoxin domain-containing protein [Solirubrobacterales bacterium]|nr:type IV toxin-antitoxin system AbiEi family antitoxin domain-containing protein [Solirubrobacterales bacterium]